MLAKLLINSLYIGARDEDIREAKAQKAVESGKLTIDDAAREYNVKGKALAQRVRLSRKRSQAFTGDNRRRRVIATQKTLGKVKEVRPGIFQITEGNKKRVIEGEANLNIALLGKGQPSKFKRVVEVSKLPSRQKQALKQFERSGFKVDITGPDNDRLRIRGKGGVDFTLNKFGQTIGQRKGRGPSTLTADFSSLRSVEQSQLKQIKKNLEKKNDLSNSQFAQVWKNQGYKVKAGKKDTLIVKKGDIVLEVKTPEVTSVVREVPLKKGELGPKQLIITPRVNTQSRGASGKTFGDKPLRFDFNKLPTTKRRDSKSFLISLNSLVSGLPKDKRNLITSLKIDVATIKTVLPKLRELNKIKKDLKSGKVVGQVESEKVIKRLDKINKELQDDLTTSKELRKVSTFLIKDLSKKTFIFSKNVVLGIGEEVSKIAKGFNNIYLISKRIGSLTTNSLKNFKDLASNLKLLSQVKTGKKKLSKDKLNKLNKDLEKNIKNIKREYKNNDKVQKIARQEETKIARDLSILGVAAPLGLSAASAAVQTVTKVTLGSIGLFTTGQQTLETIKDPTGKNFGKLVFYGAPTAIGFLKFLGKLSPNFRPTVKNVELGRSQLRERSKLNRKVLVELNQLEKKKSLTLLERRFVKKGKSRLVKENQLIKQSIAELNWLLKNKEILKSTEFNPLVHTKNFKKLQGSYKEGVHVSTEPNINKLFGNEIEGFATVKDLFKKIPSDELSKGLQTEVLSKSKIREVFKLQRRKSLDLVLKYTQTNNLFLTGGYAQNLLVRKSLRRSTSDIDLLSKSPLKDARAIKRKILKDFPNAEVTIQKLPKAQRVLLNGKELVDIGKYKGDSFITQQGFNVLTKEVLIKKKLKAVKDYKRDKNKKDVKDIIRLSNKKVKKSDILVSRENPSNVFEAIEIKGGMGKDRLKFDETHMYWDFAAAIGYSQGKRFSIIKFPKVKIQKFPKSLRVKINKAAKGQLSVREQNNLRRALNKYIKDNPGKFFLGPRTASLPFGEREIALSVGSKFFKKDLYKTFDNDLQTFISVMEVAFKEQKSKGILARLLNSWKDRPVKTLKLRLTNPDILELRKIKRVLERDLPFSLTKRQQLALLIEKFVFINPKKVIKLKIKQLLELIKSLRTNKFKLKSFSKNLLNSIIDRINSIKNPQTKNKLVQELNKSAGKNRVVKDFLKKQDKQFKKSRVKSKELREISKNKRRSRLKRESKKPRRRVPSRKRRSTSRVRKTTPNRTRERVRTRKRPVKTRTRRVVTRKRERNVQRKRRTTVRRKPTRNRKRVRTTKRVTSRKRVPTRKKKKPTRIIIPKEKKKLEKKVLNKALKNSKFVFVPDLVSRLSGIKASKKEKKLLLKKGRIFSGLERRKLT